MPGKVPDPGGGGQNQRPRQAKVGEQRLALFPEHRAAVLQKRQRHVAQRKPHHLAAGRVGRDQAAQTGLGRRDRVPRLPGQLVAAAVAAGGRVADAAGGHQHRPRPQLPAVGGAHAHAAAVLDQQPFGGALQQLCAGGVAAQRLQHVGGAVALREHPAAPLGFQRHAQALEQFHRRIGRENVQRRVQKPRIVPHHRQKGRHIAVVGQVAAPLAGDQDLLSRPLGVVLQKRHAGALLAGGAGGHQAGRARTDDQQVRHWHGGVSFRSGCPPPRTGSAAGGRWPGTSSRCRCQSWTPPQRRSSRSAAPP